MIDQTLTEGLAPQTLIALADELQKASRVVLTCHVAPDGDAIGSTLGLARVMRAMGRETAVVVPDMPPKNLAFLPGFADIIVASYHPERARITLSKADLIVCLDFNEGSRLADIQSAVESATARKVLIDHHLSPTLGADVIVSRPGESSTCFLVLKTLIALGFKDLIDCEAATCLYTGMMTDTGSFTYNSNDAAIYAGVAFLVAKGVKPNEIHKRVFDTATENCLRLNAYALYRKMRVIREHHVALIVLTQSELHEFDYQRGDTEGLVNKPLAMEDVEWSIFVREDSNQVKISCRSKNSFPVNKFCELFGGGGHVNAAGGEFHGSLDACVDRILELIPEFDKYLS